MAAGSGADVHGDVSARSMTQQAGVIDVSDKKEKIAIFNVNFSPSGLDFGPGSRFQTTSNWVKDPTNNIFIVNLSSTLMSLTWVKDRHFA